MGRQRFISTLALCASFFALGVIALGAFTRLVDAGLGCPDWPGCYGSFTVPLTEKARELAVLHYPDTHLNVYKAWAEMLHRYFVGGLSLFIMAVIFAIFKAPSRVGRLNIILVICLLSLLAYQIFLGQLTVTLKLLPIIVTQHLLGGFLILSALWLVYLNNVPGLEKIISSTSFFKENKKGFLLLLSIIALIILLLQITLGAWVSTNYASLSCPDFPFCLNDQTVALHFKAAFNVFMPMGVNYEGGVLSAAIRQTIQMTHRLGALIFTLYMVGFLSFAMTKLKYSPELMKSIYLMLGLLIIQICIGITNVMFKLPLITAVSHNLVAVLLLLAVITFIFKLVSAEPKVLKL